MADLQRYIQSKLDKFRNNIAENVVKMASGGVGGVAARPVIQQAAPRIQQAAQQVQRVAAPLMQSPTRAQAPVLGINVPKLNFSDLSPTNFNTPVLGPIRRFQAEDKARFQALQQQSADIMKRYQAKGVRVGIDGSGPVTPEERKIVKDAFRASTEQQINMVANIGGGANDTRKAAFYLRSKLDKEAAGFLKSFAAKLETKGQGLRAVSREEMQTVGAILNDAYGVQSLHWSPQKMKRVVDQVLGKVGSMKNRAGLGLGIEMLEEVQNPTKPFYNVKRLKVAQGKQQATKTLIEENKGAFDAVTGPKMGAGEISKRAQLSSDDVIKQVGRQTTEQLGAAQLRLRQTIAKMADSGQVNRDLLEKLVADKSFATNNARLLQQRVIDAGPQTPNGKLMQQMLDDILKVDDDLDAILAKAQGVNFEDPKQAAVFYREFIKPKAGEWVDKLRYNSMLSSPLTQINNMSSNVQGTGLLTPVQKTVEGTIDALVSGLTGRERTRFAGEGVAYAGGYAKNVKQAYSNFINILRGTQLSNDPDTRFTPLATSAAGQAVEGVLDLPTKFLQAADEFFGTLTRGGLEASSDYRIARGGTKAINAAGEAEELLFKGKLTGEGKGIVSNFIGDGGNIVRAATESKNQSVRWLAKLTVPFVNIGTNLAKAGAEYNPALGTLNMIGNNDKTAQAAKIAIGSAVTMLGGSLALSDRLTFGEDATRRDAQREAGLQPYSIKIGDEWYSYAKMHPAIGFQLATTAALMQALKERRITESDAEVIANGAWNGLKFIADATYFKNVGDFVNTVGGDVEGAARLTTNIPSQLIPFRALMGWIARAIDDKQRKVDTNADMLTQSLQQLMTQVPGLSQQVPARLGPSGLPIENQHRLVNAVSPARITTENPQGVEYYQGLLEESRQTKEKNDLKKMAESQVEQEISGGSPNAPVTSLQAQGGAQSQPSAYEEELAKQRAKRTGKVQEVGDKLFVFKNGEVKTFSKSDLAQKQADADYSLIADRLKRADDSSTWVGITDQYIAFLRERQKQLDPLTEQDKITSTQNKIEDLMAQVEKFKKQGGFKKGRSIRVAKVRVGMAKVKKLKAVKPKKVKLKKISVKPVKVANPRLKQAR